MAGLSASPSPGWLGADVGQLDQVSARCRRAGEATGQVARSLRAQVLEQEWASGPFFQAYRASVASHLIPALTTLAEALHRFGRVVSAQADAQRRISAGESFDLAAIPQYASPVAAKSDRDKAPPSVNLPPGSELFGPLWKLEGSHTQQVGPASSTTDWQVRALGLDGGFRVTSTSAAASGRAYLLDYSYAERGEVGPVDIAVEKSGSIGVDLSGGGSANLNSLKTLNIGAEAEAFAGGRAGVEAKFEVGGLIATGNVEGWAGVGWARGFKFGWQEDGSFTIGRTVGGAFGLGGKFSGSLTADRELMESMSQALESVGDTAKDAGDWLTSGWDTKPRSR